MRLAGDPLTLNWRGREELKRATLTANPRQSATNDLIDAIDVDDDGHQNRDARIWLNEYSNRSPPVGSTHCVDQRLPSNRKSPRIAGYW